MNACRSRRLVVSSVCAVLVCLGIAMQFESGVPSATGSNSSMHAPLLYLTPTQGPTSIPSSTPTPNPFPSVGLELVSQLTGGFSASVVTGTLAYMGEGKALTVLDVSTPQQPVRRASVPLPDVALDIAVVNTTLYVLEESALYLFDVSVPDAPRLLSTFTLTFINGAFATRLQVIDGLVYLAGGMVHIIDVRNPTAPTSLGHIELQQDFSDFQVVGGRAYVVGIGFQIIDVSDPTNLTLLGSINNETYYNQVQVADTLAYVSDVYGELSIFDVSNPASPTLKSVYVSGDRLSSLVVSPSGALGYEILNDTSFNSPPRLQILDLSDPLHPALRGSTALQASPSRLQVLGTQVFLTSYDQLTLLSLASPDTPLFLGAFATLSDPSAVQVVEGMAYITTQGGLVIADVRNPALPKLRGGYAFPSYPSHLQVVGNLAYVVDGYYGGLKIIDTSDADRPRSVGSYSTLGDAKDVQVVGNLAYIADYNGGLVIVDVSDPAHPTLRGHFSPRGYPYAITVRVVGTTAYIAASSDDNAHDQNSLMIIDIRDPAAPALLASYPLKSYPKDVHVEGNRAYVSNDDEISILDVTDPSTPVLQGTYSIVKQGPDDTSVQIQNELAYIGTYKSFQIVDLTNALGPYLRAYISLPATPVFTHVAGNLAFIATENEGLEILRIPPDIKVLRNYMPQIIRSGPTPYPDKTPVVAH